MHPLSRSRLEQGSLCCLLLLGCIVGVWMSLRQMLPEVLQTALLRQQLFPWLLLEMAGFLLCSGLAGFSAVGQPVACAALFSAWYVVRLEHFAADDHPCGSGAALADAIRDWSIVFAAAGSKGNAVALEPVLLLCVSSAVGRKYAALPAAVSGAVCSDTGII